MRRSRQAIRVAADAVRRADARTETAYALALRIAAASPIGRLMQPALNMADSEAAIDIGTIATHLFRVYDADGIRYEDSNVHEQAGYLFGLAVAFTMGRGAPLVATRLRTRRRAR